jgi:murein DD-endopeptidase MepM/ murein hydrolase activator NlpD
MRITRVALSFFTVGLLAGTFEQAAGVGYTERRPRVPGHAVMAASLVPASPVLKPAMPVLVRESRLPASDDDANALHQARGARALIELGDGSVAEAVAAFTGAAAKGVGEVNVATAPQPASQPATTVALASPSPAASQPEQSSEPSRKLRPFFDPLPPEAEILVVPEPKIAKRPQEFILPFEKGRVTSMFNQGRRHPAIDLAGPLGTQVYATTRKQRVTFAGWRGGYGNLVITRDPQGRHHYYGHLHRLLARVGVVLDQGETLGLLGTTGRSTGPHVHYEVRTPNGRHLDPSRLLFAGRVGRGYAWNTPRPEGTGTRLAARSGQPRPR